MVVLVVIVIPILKSKPHLKEDLMVHLILNLRQGAHVQTCNFDGFDLLMINYSKAIHGCVALRSRVPFDDLQDTGNSNRISHRCGTVEHTCP